jgi:hypothetical protein
MWGVVFTACVIFFIFLQAYHLKEQGVGRGRGYQRIVQNMDRA